MHRPGANSTQFFWLDLREFLAVPPEGGPPDDGPADDIADHAGVKLLTGTELSCSTPGYYRLCFTALDRDRMVDAVERRCRHLISRPRLGPS